MQRPLVVFLVIGLSLMLGSASALAEPVAVTIDDDAPKLEERDGGWTVALGFTNLTDDKVELAIKASDANDPGCRLTPEKSVLPAARHSDAEVTVPAGCEVGDDGINFKVIPAGSDAFDVTAAPKPDKKPDWDQLWVFPILVGAVFVASLILFFIWSDRSKKHVPSKHVPSYNHPLKHLDASWSFKDNWVSNVTVAGGLLTALVGSTDVVKATLGDNADSSVILATIGAAVATAFIGAAPIVLIATKTRKDRPKANAKDLRDPAVMVIGLLAASAVALAGALGQLWILYIAGKELNLGGWEDRLLVVVVLAAVLIAWYAIRTLRTTIELGSKPAPTTTSEAVRAAKLIVKALKAKDDVDASLEGVEGVAPAQRTAAQLEAAVAAIDEADEAAVPSRTALL